MPGPAFPDRTYVLRVAPRAGKPKPVVTENGSPVLGLAISSSRGGASGTYVVTYRSLLPPQVEAVVRATIAGVPAGTATYTTPALDLAASENAEPRWIDPPYVTIVALAALLALTALALLTRSTHRF